MSLSTALKGVAAKILSTQGQEITVYRETDNAFDAVLGKSQSVTSTYTLNCVVDTYDIEELDGTNVKANDIKLLTEATDNVPAIGDLVFVGSTNKRIMNVSPVSPAGINIIYEVQVRV